MMPGSEAGMPPTRMGSCCSPCHNSTLRDLHNLSDDETAGAGAGAREAVERCWDYPIM
jgi:hypothetical protein